MIGEDLCRSVSWTQTFLQYLIQFGRVAYQVSLHHLFFLQETLIDVAFQFLYEAFGRNELNTCQSHIIMIHLIGVSKVTRYLQFGGEGAYWSLHTRAVSHEY